MSERFAGTDAEADDDQNSAEQPKKDSKKKLSLVPFARIEVETKEQPSDDNKFRLRGEGLGIFGVKKPEEAAPQKDVEPAEPEQSKDTAPQPDELAAGGEESPVIAPENLEAAATPLEARELPPQEKSDSQLNGGEVLLDLHQSVEELVVPLRTEQAMAEQPPEGLPEGPSGFEQTEVPGSNAIGAELPPMAPAAGGGGGEKPPVPPGGDGPEGFNDEPDEPEEPSFDPEDSIWRPRRTAEAEADGRPEPAEAYRQYMLRQNANQQPAQPEVTQADVDDAVQRATKVGMGRGLATGLLVGGAYEHFKHKRREKRERKRFDAQQRQLNQARGDYAFGRREQARERDQAAAQLGSVESRLAGTERRLAEQQQAMRQHEAAPDASRPPEAIAPAEQAPQTTPEHVVVDSSWLRTKVDRRTGQVVEDPEQPRGPEFYQERAAETNPVRSSSAAIEAGGVAILGAAVASADDVAAGAPGSGTTPPPNVPDASMHGRPADFPLQTGIPTQRGLGKQPNPAPIWPWVVALVVVVVILIALL